VIELMTSMATAVSNGIVKTTTRSAGVLVKSGLAWIVLLSVLRHESPGLLLQSAVNWSGLNWSATSTLDWMHARTGAIEGLAILLLWVSISGVTIGSASWTNSHGPLGISLSLAVLLETGAPATALIGALAAGPVFAAIVERDAGSGIVVFIAPWIYIAAPFFVLSNLLGLRPAERRQATPQRRPSTLVEHPRSMERRKQAIENLERISPPPPHPATLAAIERSTRSTA